jgi:hypothetical protein
MSRKSVLLGFGTVLLLAGTVTLVLLLLVRHEPDFYRRIALPAGQERKQRSSEFQTNFSQLVSEVMNQDSEPWEFRFTDAQINSYLEEDFLRSGSVDKLLPEGIRSPRVAIEPDLVRLAFRYGSGPWSTIISVDLRVWLAAKQPNAVVLEIQALHAGSLPISAQSLLEQISQAARNMSGAATEVTWYRHEGNPVAVIRFQADKPQPTVYLRRLELHHGEIRIGGRSSEAAAIRAMLSPLALKPVAN